MRMQQVSAAGLQISIMAWLLSRLRLEAAVLLCPPLPSPFLASPWGPLPLSIFAYYPHRSLYLTVPAYRLR